MAVIKVGNNSIGKISVIEPYDETIGGLSVEYPPFDEPWVRPSEWLDMPNIGSGDNKIALLLYMHSGVPLEPRIYLRGTYIGHNIYPTYSTIDWGDGQTVTVSGLRHDSNSAEYIFPQHHAYRYEDLPESSEFTYDGKTARQALIQIDNSISGCYYLELNRLTANDLDSNIRDVHDGYVRNGQSTNLLDLHVAGQNMEYFYLGNDYERSIHDRLESVIIEGDMDLKTAHRQFRYCTNLQSLSYPSGAWRNTTDFQEMFYFCRKLKEIPPLVTSNATSVQSIFNNCQNIRNIPDIDTSNVTNFSSFMNECRLVEDIPILNYSNGTTFQNAFSNMRSLKIIPSGLGLTSLTNGISMFYRCDSLVAMPNDFFDQFSNNITDARNMFTECRKLKNMPRIHFPNCIHMREFAMSCNSLEKLHLGDLSKVRYEPSTSYGFYNAFNACWNVRKVTIDYPESFIARSYQGMFSSMYSLEENPYLNTSSGVSLNGLFAYNVSAKKAPVLDWTSCTTISSIYNGNRNLRKVGGFKNVNNKLTNINDGFRDCFALEEFPSGLFQDYNSAPGYCQNVFYSTSIEEIPNINISGVNNSSTNNNIFYNMYHLKYVGNIIFGSGANCRNLFSSCSRLKRVGYGDASLVSDMVSAFNSCLSLEWCDVSGIPVSVGFNNCFLSSGALEHIFYNLKDGVTGQSIDIRSNYGTSELHPDTIAIATSKGWTVTT